MLRSCILDKRKHKVFLGGYRNIQMFSKRQRMSKVVEITESMSSTSNLPNKTAIFNNFYWVKQQVRSSALAVRQYMPDNLPYIFHKKAPKGNFPSKVRLRKIPQEQERREGEEGS